MGFVDLSISSAEAALYYVDLFGFSVAVDMNFVALSISCLEAAMHFADLFENLIESAMYFVDLSISSVEAAMHFADLFGSFDESHVGLADICLSSVETAMHFADLSGGSVEADMKFADLTECSVDDPMHFVDLSVNCAEAAVYLFGLSVSSAMCIVDCQVDVETAIRVVDGSLSCSEAGESAWHMMAPVGFGQRSAHSVETYVYCLVSLVEVPRSSDDLSVGCVETDENSVGLSVDHAEHSVGFYVPTVICSLNYYEPSGKLVCPPLFAFAEDTLLCWQNSPGVNFLVLMMK